MNTLLRKLPCILVIFCCWLNAYVSAQPITLVKDINKMLSYQDVGPTQMVNWNGVLFFSAYDSSHGYELWKSDGTAAGTTIVADLNPGPASSYPNNLTVSGNNLFFTASYPAPPFTNTSDLALWKSDGTTAGTTHIRNFFSGAYNTGISRLTAGSNGLAFFVANDNVHGYELWKSDGTLAGTAMVHDVSPGAYPSAGYNEGPISIVSHGTDIYFTYYLNSSTNTGIWKTNGTAAGTVQLAGSIPGVYRNLTSTPNGVYYTYTSFNSLQSDTLFVTNGTVNGTIAVANGTNISNLTFAGNSLYYASQGGLWKNNGIYINTQVQAGNSAGPYNPTKLCNIGSTLYFAAHNGTDGFELWKSDGTPAGTMMVRNIHPSGDGISEPPPLYQNMIDPPKISRLTVAGNTVYFRANDGTHGAELWKSDGTSAGTVIVKDIFPGADSSYPNAIVPIGNVVYFSAKSNANSIQLWKSDGTTSGTSLLMNSPGTSSSQPAKFYKAGNTLYFEANDGISGAELWRSDGTAAGTSLVKDICSGAGGTSITFMGQIGSAIFFSASDTSHGTELWKTDGTAAGTVMVKDINAQTVGGYNQSSTPQGGVVLNGLIYFMAGDGLTDRGLWKSDGTSAGTVLVKGNIPLVFSIMAQSGGLIYFSSYDQVNRDVHLWKSDGSTTGTAVLKTIHSGNIYASYAIPAMFTACNGALYFIAADSTTGTELWKTDGTAAGTVIVRDIYPGPTGSGPNYLVCNGSTLYFSAFTANSGAELWKSDGTATGTVMVKDIYPGYWSSNPGYILPADSLIYFTAADSSSGTELWKSDGTTAGTVMVKDTRPGAAGSFVRVRCYVGGTLYFITDDSTHGSELWKSDGSAASTTLVQDLDPGIASGVFTTTDILPVANSVFISATVRHTGKELYRLEFTPLATGTITGSPFCAGSPLRVPFTVTGAINTGNTFTAQLSDGNGSFASPLTIGSLIGMVSDTISATLPPTLAAGSGYRIRVVASNPTAIGSDNGADLAVHASIVQSIGTTVADTQAVQSTPTYLTGANCEGIATITPTGLAPVGGTITSSVTIDTAVQSYNGHAYVQRHFGITPAVNANNATATITLYYLQSEFTAYNAANGPDPDLPTSGSNSDPNIGNLRITQYHGTAPNNTPGFYTWTGNGPAVVTIIPTSVYWNSIAARWEVTFPVNGFSGFFASGIANIPLPVKLLSFNAQQVDDTRNRLDWQTAAEEPGTVYEVLSSSDGRDFLPIGAVNGTGTSNYHWYDEHPYDPLTYYRLKVKEGSGNTIFSHTVSVYSSHSRIGKVTVTPIPADHSVVVMVTEKSFYGKRAVIKDVYGREVFRFDIAATQTINISNWSAGFYWLCLPNGTTLKLVKT